MLFLKGWGLRQLGACCIYILWLVFWKQMGEIWLLG